MFIRFGASCAEYKNYRTNKIPKYLDKDYLDNNIDMSVIKTRQKARFELPVMCPSQIKPYKIIQFHHRAINLWSLSLLSELTVILLLHISVVLTWWLQIKVISLRLTFCLNIINYLADESPSTRKVFSTNADSTFNYWTHDENYLQKIIHIQLRKLMNAIYSILTWRLWEVGITVPQRKVDFFIGFCSRQRSLT